LASGVTLGVGFLLWLTIPSESRSIEAAANEAPADQRRRPIESADDDESISGLEARPPSATHKEEREETPPAVQKLEPGSAEFSHHVDDVLPSRLYEQAVSSCYRPGLDRNERITLHYRLRARGGRIDVADLRVGDSKMRAELADCIVSAVRAAAWSDERMPDWEDADELYVQVSGMKKYLGDDAEDPDEHIARSSSAATPSDDSDARP
jgi:hypothetical protein